MKKIILTCLLSSVLFSSICFAFIDKIAWLPVQNYINFKTTVCPEAELRNAEPGDFTEWILRDIPVRAGKIDNILKNIESALKRSL